MPTEEPTEAAATETKPPTDAPYTKPPVTDEPTDEPTAGSTTSELQGPTETTGLQITLNGISSIEDKRAWEETTANFYENVYDDTPDIDDATVEVSITSTRRALRRRLMNGSATFRGLQDSSVVVTYTQITKYRSQDPNLTIEEIVVYPLSTKLKRDEYVGELKGLDDGYEQLTDVSEISISSDVIDKNPDGGVDGGNDAGDGGGLHVGAIIGIVCGSVALLILIIGFVYYQQRNKDEDSDPANTTTVSSTLDVQTSSGGGAGTGASLPTYGDGSVATVDYDYTRAYGGAGNHSLSDAGGTLGSRTRQTAADTLTLPGNSDPAMQLQPGSGNTIFSDDPTFDQAYEDVREELLDIYAPAGKLGVVIDTPDDGAPVVHAVKDSSPIAEKVQVGDKLVAVDDEDVRAMTAIKVSKLISRKSNNASRKLTIIRHVSNN